MTTRSLHRVLFLTFVTIALGGCGFRTYMRDARDPALSVEPPCYSGDICGFGPNGGFVWVADVIHATGR